MKSSEAGSSGDVPDVLSLSYCTTAIVLCSVEFCVLEIYIPSLDKDRVPSQGKASLHQRDQDVASKDEEHHGDFGRALTIPLGSASPGIHHRQGSGQGTRKHNKKSKLRNGSKVK